MKHILRGDHYDETYKHVGRSRATFMLSNYGARVIFQNKTGRAIKLEWSEALDMLAYLQKHEATIRTRAQEYKAYVKREERLIAEWKRREREQA